MTVATMKGSATERKGVVTFKGSGVTLLGPEVRVVDRAPDFHVLSQDLSPVTLASGKGKVRIVSVVTSLDTSVCDAQTRRFNEAASQLPGGVEVWTISADMPFAQKRWCGAAGIERVKVFSDHREASFGLAYGCLIKELRLLARSIFVIDQTDTVRHVEYVSEVASHPNYDRALAAARELVK